MFKPSKLTKNERKRIKDGFERDKEDVSRPLGIALSKPNDCASLGYMACIAIVHGGCSVHVLLTAERHFLIKVCLINSAIERNTHAEYRK